MIEPDRRGVVPLDPCAPHLEIRLLGGLAIAVDGCPVHLRYRKSAALFAFLLQERRPHRRSTLAGLLWSDTPEPQALHSLRTLLHDLRLHFDTWILVEGDTVAFDVSRPYLLDTELLADFSRREDDHVREGVAGMEEQISYREQAKRLLDVYVGEFLAGFSVTGAALFDEWTSATSAHLRRIAASAMSRWSTQSAKVGDWDGAIEYASHAAAIDPFDDRVRARFAEVGELASANDRDKILGQEQSLPVPVTTLVGRAGEIEEISHRLMGETRLVTVTGPGGVGKTRVAIAAAEKLRSNFSIGACYVDLSPFAGAGHGVASTAIAHALGAPSGIEDEMVSWLTKFLSRVHLLMVLDNCDALSGLPDLVATLLASSSDLRVIATSRASLKVSGESVMLLKGLPVVAGSTSAATELFLARARDSGSNLAGSDSEMSAIEALCEMCGGLPLAIELMAARTRSATPSELVSRLEDGTHKLLEMAEPLNGATADRHSSVRAAISSSYQALDEQSRSMLRCMSIVTSPPRAPMVRALTGAEQLPTDSLDNLVDSSLVEVTSDSHGRSQYRLLDMVREFALHELEVSGEVASVRERHARYLLYLASLERGVVDDSPLGELYTPLDRSTKRERSPSIYECLSGYGDALDFAGRLDDLSLAARLIGFAPLYATGGFILSRGWLIDRVAAAIERRELDSLSSGVFLAGIGFLESLKYNGEAAARHLNMAIAIFRESGLRWAETEALIYLGISMTQTSSDFDGLEQARIPLERALAIAREIGDSKLIAESLNALGMIAINFGEVDRAEELFTEGSAVVEGERGDVDLALSRLRFAVVDTIRGRRQEAMEKSARAMEVLVRSHCEILATNVLGLVAINLAMNPVGDKNTYIRSATLFGAHAIMEKRLGIYPPSERGSAVLADADTTDRTEGPASHARMIFNFAKHAARNGLEPDVWQSHFSEAASMSIGEILDAVKMAAVL